MRAMAMAWLVGWLAACGGEVVVYDDGELESGLDGTPGGSGDPGAGCIPCEGDDCGMCEGMYGASYRCPGDVAPAAGCQQISSLFDDDGEYYACWSC